MKKIALILFFLASPLYAQNIHNVLTRAGQAQQCFWDDTNDRLGIGTNTPLAACHISAGVGTIDTGLMLGDGDTGIFESSDDMIDFAMGGNGWYRMSNSSIISYTTGGFLISRLNASATVPSYSFNDDGATGIGTAGMSQLSLIAGSVEGVRVTQGTDKLLITTNGGLERNITTVNAATYDTLETDHILHVTYTGTAAVTSLTLMSATCTDGRVLVIKDAGGNAAANTITIDTEGAETIDGSPTAIINGNYDSLSLYCESSNWYIY